MNMILTPELACHICGGNCYKEDGYATCKYNVAIIKGATFQHKHDMQKACKLYKNELKNFVNMANMLRPNGGSLIDIEGSVEVYRNVMEEQLLTDT